MRRIFGFILAFGLSACEATTEHARDWTIAVRPAEQGAYYGTFQSHLPTFAQAGDALYRSRTVDVGAGHAGQARTEGVELRIDRLANGVWSTVYRRSGYLNPACLVADGRTLYAVVSDSRSYALSVLAINGESVVEIARPAPLATASKVNCAIYDGALLFMTTYGSLATFNLAERRFSQDRNAFAREYEAGACTHYPHMSVAGARLFLGHNGVRCDDTNAGYIDMIGYIANASPDILPTAPWAHLLPEELRAANVWIADTWMTEDQLYFAGAYSQCPVDIAPDLAATENPTCSTAFFGVCDLSVRCEVRHTEIGQGLSGNFVRYRGDLYFLGDGFRQINIWRLRGDNFEMEGNVVHGVRCPYAFNFSSEFNGVIEGQVTDMGRCGDGVDRHVSFTLRPS